MDPSHGLLIYWDKAKSHAGFAAEQSDEKVGFMYASQGPVASKGFVTPIKHPAWKTKPSYAIVAIDDKSIDPETERIMCKRAGSKVTEIKGSHNLFITNAKAAAEVIEAAAITKAKQEAAV